MGGINVGVACSASAPVSFSAWLFTYAGYGIFQLVLSAISFLIYMVSKGNVGATYVSIGVIILGITFTAIWTIVGLVSTFAFSLGCYYYASSVFTMMIITMVYQLIWIGVHIYIAVKIRGLLTTHT